MAVRDQIGTEVLGAGTGCIGAPVELRETLHTFAEAGVDQTVFIWDRPSADRYAGYTTGRLSTSPETRRASHCPSDELPTSRPSSTITLPRRIVITG